MVIGLLQCPYPRNVEQVICLCAFSVRCYPSLASQSLHVPGRHFVVGPFWFFGKNWYWLRMERNLAEVEEEKESVEMGCCHFQWEFGNEILEVAETPILAILEHLCEC